MTNLEVIHFFSFSFSCFQNLQMIYVFNMLVIRQIESFKNNKLGYRICFHFRRNPFFQNQMIVKELHLGMGGELTVITVPFFLWMWNGLLWDTFIYSGFKFLSVCAFLFAQGLRCRSQTQFCGTEGRIWSVVENHVEHHRESTRASSIGSVTTATQEGITLHRYISHVVKCRKKSLGAPTKHSKEEVLKTDELHSLVSRSWRMTCTETLWDTIWLHSGSHERMEGNL